MADITKKQFKKLQDAIETNMDNLKGNRESQVEFIRNFVGSHYSDNGTEGRIPLNLLELMVSTYQNSTVSQNPKAECTSKKKKYQPAAKTLELAVDHLVQEINLEDTLGDCFLSSMFTIGIAKVGLNKSSTIELGGVFHDVGQPFTDPVQFDDFVYDTAAYSFEKCSFMGDRVKLPLEDVKACGLYDKKVVEKLTPMEKRSYDTTKEGERASQIGYNQETLRDNDDLREMVQLWNIWLPHENIVITMADDDSISEPLSVFEWDGPEHGMYRFLMYQKVPGNIMPLSPVALTVDLHELTNKLYNKVSKQALRQKTITGYKAGADKDASRVVNAEDGEVIRMDDPNSVNEFKTGGPDNVNMLFTQQARQQFSYIAGNLDAMAGLANQADTASQEKLIKSSTEGRLGSYQQKFEKFTREILEDLAWYLWNDPLIDLPLVKRMGDYEVPVTFSPEEREGDFFDYNIRIVPYSMHRKTPQEEIEAVDASIQKLAPWVPLMQQQGVGMDFAKIVNFWADKGDLEVLKDLITFATPQEEPQMGASTGNAPVKIEQMTKEYMHSYQSKPNMAGAENMMNQQLMSGLQGKQNDMALGQ